MTMSANSRTGMLTLLAAFALVVAVVSCSESSTTEESTETPVDSVNTTSVDDSITTENDSGQDAMSSTDSEASDAGASVAVNDSESEPVSSSSVPEDSRLGDEDTSGESVEQAPTVTDNDGNVMSTEREQVPSALRDPENESHPEPLLDLSEIRGVVPPDAIPALDDPDFVTIDEADWLPGVEPVVALVLNSDARAYPLRLMTWHELVNGTVGGIPVTVSYCPLCNSAVAYDRRVGERILDFGTSGALLNSSLVMYDRQTESLWSHYTGEAIVGHLTGAQLDLIPVQTVSFRTFIDAFPNGLVLSQDTGHSRGYGFNPYEYYDSSERPFLFGGPFDDRLDPLKRVVAVRFGTDAAVIPYELLSEQQVVEFDVGDRQLVALHEPGVASALDTSEIAQGADVGATGVFMRQVDGNPLQLAPVSDGGFVDTLTGLTFDILGRGAGGDASGLSVQLDSVEHLDTFWFAAAAFYPDATIVTG